MQGTISSEDNMPAMAAPASDRCCRSGPMMLRRCSSSSQNIAAASSARMIRNRLLDHESSKAVRRPESSMAISAAAAG
ncbi:Uncharacterised protein [Chromobacterium violaceum]|uniref:Uncharacterized protein n=1 Tax=Chromobacterium violaceum TaxID=536 RepID=A0A3S4IH25_CHRVL|nr:Uncharacterised protein [Chromobacterium violaceum]